MDPGRLNHYGLGFNDILGALQNENVNIPGGSVSRTSDDLMLRVPRTFTNAQDIENVAVKRVGDQPVFLRDLGRVTDGYASRNSYAHEWGSCSDAKHHEARGGKHHRGRRPSTCRRTRRIDSLARGGQLPNSSRPIRRHSEHDHGASKQHLHCVVGCECPAVLHGNAQQSLRCARHSVVDVDQLCNSDILGFTLNMVVLFSLILALGMLVDNAIVVVENIYRHLELGYSKTDAAVKGTKEVAVAIAASTATTIAAFFPMVFWGGIMGEFMGYLPKTVIIVLLSSLFVAIFILPVATSKMMRAVKTSSPVEQNTALRLEEGTVRYTIMMAYHSVLVFSIRYRYLSAGIGVATLLFTFVVYGFFNHGTELFANVEPNRARVQVQLLMEQNWRARMKSRDRLRPSSLQTKT